MLRLLDRNEVRGSGTIEVVFKAILLLLLLYNILLYSPVSSTSITTIIILLKDGILSFPQLFSNYRLKNCILIYLEAYLPISIPRDLVLNEFTLKIISNGRPIIDPFPILLFCILLLNNAIRAILFLRSPKNPDLSLKAPSKVVFVRETDSPLCSRSWIFSKYIFCLL